MTELISPVQNIDESIIDGLDAFELIGEKLTSSSSNEAAGTYRKLSSSLSNDQSRNVVDEGVISTQSAAAFSELEKDMPGNRDLADEVTESSFYGYIYMDFENLQNYQGGEGTIFIAGSDVDIHVHSSGGSGVFNIEIWDWNYNGLWHPDIEETSQVAIVATSVSLVDIMDPIHTQDPYNDYPPLNEQDGIITVTLPQDLPFRYMNNNNLLSFFLYQITYS